VFFYTFTIIILFSFSFHVFLILFHTNFLLCHCITTLMKTTNVKWLLHLYFCKSLFFLYFFLYLYNNYFVIIFYYNYFIMFLDNGLLNNGIFVLWSECLGLDIACQFPFDLRFIIIVIIEFYSFSFLLTSA